MYCEWPVGSHDGFHSHTIVKDGERIEYHKCKNCTATATIVRANGIMYMGDSLFFGKIGETVLTNGSQRTFIQIRPRSDNSCTIEKMHDMIRAELD